MTLRTRRILRGLSKSLTAHAGTLLLILGYLQGQGAWLTTTFGPDATSNLMMGFGVLVILLRAKTTESLESKAMKWRSPSYCHPWLEALSLLLVSPAVLGVAIWLLIAAVVLLANETIKWLWESLQRGIEQAREIARQDAEISEYYEKWRTREVVKTEEITREIPANCLFLRELVYLADTESFLPAAVALAGDAATVSGGRFDPARHVAERQIKALTRHQFELARQDGGYRCRMVLDL